MSVICPICFESFKNSDIIHTTDCGHTFHFLCLNEWRNRSQKCPQCRKEYQKTYQLYLSFEDSERNTNELNGQIKNMETNFLHQQKQRSEMEKLISDLQEKKRQSEYQIVKLKIDKIVAWEMCKFLLRDIIQRELLN